MAEAEAALETLAEVAFVAGALGFELLGHTVQDPDDCLVFHVEEISLCHVLEAIHVPHLEQGELVAAREYHAAHRQVHKGLLGQGG